VSEEKEREGREEESRREEEERSERARKREGERKKERDFCSTSLSFFDSKAIAKGFKKEIEIANRGRKKSLIKCKRMEETQGENPLKVKTEAKMQYRRRIFDRKNGSYSSKLFRFV
jgi:hypothetical protein